MKKWEVFSLRTVRKKLLMVSKLAGIALVFSYIVSTRLPLDSNTAFLLCHSFRRLMKLCYRLRDKTPHYKINHQH